jgi:hypothetical protein
MYGRDDVRREWEKRIYIYKKELCSLYSSPNIIRIDKHKEQDGQGM